MRRREFTKAAFSAGIVTAFAGCASLTGTEPLVKLTNLRILESSGLSMRFGVDLTIANPSPIPVSIDGIAWYFSLEGNEILSGVTSDIPALEPYSEVPLSLEASTNLGGMLGLIAKLANGQDEAFDYELKTRIGLGGLRFPYEHIDSGSINLSR